MARWYTLDTRQLSNLEPLVDGFVHVLPHSTMHKHWVQSDCWCEPMVTWNPVVETIIVSHYRKVPPQMEHIND